MTDRYSNGKIYKSVNNVDDEIYIGSTCLPFPKRLYWHKSAAKRNSKRKVYSHLNTIGWENVRIILIETFPCESKAELEKRERHWYDELSPSLNSNVPSRSKEEYAQISDAKKKATVHKKLLMCKINGFLAYHKILSDDLKQQYFRFLEKSNLAF